MKPHHFLPVAVHLLAACGVPRQTLTLAHAQAAVPAGDLSDAQVAAALRAQADQWQNFAALLAQRELGWKVKFPDIDSIVATAWKWHSTHPKGYADRNR